MCWKDLNDIKDDFEDICFKYIGGIHPSGMGYIKWVFNLGLIKLMLKYICSTTH